MQNCFDEMISHQRRTGTFRENQTSTKKRNVSSVLVLNSQIAIVRVVTYLTKRLKFTYQLQTLFPIEEVEREKQSSPFYVTRNAVAINTERITKEQFSSL